MRIEQILKQNTVGKMEVDFYVPVRIDFKENDIRDKELFYYRMINPKSSFVEMSINSVTNKIVNVTLLSINDVEEVEGKLECLNTSKEEGNPIIDMNTFKDSNIITDNLNFKVMKHEKSIYIIQQQIKVYRRILMYKMDLLLNEQNSIVGFVFGEFSVKEWEVIHDSIDKSLSVVL